MFYICGTYEKHIINITITIIRIIVITIVFSNYTQSIYTHIYKEKMRIIDLKEKKNCVCWNHMFETCDAIEPSVFRKFGCIGCAFYKTEAEYKRQTGRTYEEEMKQTKVYGRKKL